MVLVAGGEGRGGVRMVCVVECPPLSLAGLLPPPACVAGLGLTQAGPIGLYCRSVGV